MAGLLYALVCIAVFLFGYERGRKSGKTYIVGFNKVAIEHIVRDLGYEQAKQILKKVEDESQEMQRDLLTYKLSGLDEK